MSQFEALSDIGIVGISRSHCVIKSKEADTEGKVGHLQNHDINDRLAELGTCARHLNVLFIKHTGLLQPQISNLGAIFVTQVMTPCDHDV
jgi:hypothetical protein